jgi:hypothetical protein
MRAGPSHTIAGMHRNTDQRQYECYYPQVGSLWFRHEASELRASSHRHEVTLLAIANDRCHGVLFGMRQRQSNVGKADAFGANLRGSVELDVRCHARLPSYLNIAPPHPSYASAEQLHHSFLGREPASELGRSPPRVPDLAFGIDSFEEPVPILTVDPFHAVDLDDVDAGD